MLGVVYRALTFKELVFSNEYIDWDVTNEILNGLNKNIELANLLINQVRENINIQKQFCIFQPFLIDQILCLLEVAIAKMKELNQLVQFDNQIEAERLSPTLQKTKSTYAGFFKFSLPAMNDEQQLKKEKIDTALSTLKFFKSSQRISMQPLASSNANNSNSASYLDSLDTSAVYGDL